MANDVRRDGHEREPRLGEPRLRAHDAALIVEAVEERRDVIGIARDALRRVVARRAVDLLGVFLDLLDELYLRCIGEQRKLRLCRELEPRILRLAEDAHDARVRVLDIVDGIVVRLFLREVEIEIELTVE